MGAGGGGGAESAGCSGEPVEPRLARVGAGNSPLDGLYGALARGAGEGLAGVDGAAAGGCPNTGSVGAGGAFGGMDRRGSHRSGCGCDCPRQTMNSSAPTAINATRMPIWTSFIWDLLLSLLCDDSGLLFVSNCRWLGGSRN